MSWEDQDKGKKDADGLTPMQSLFAEEYLLDLNAYQAAVRAGYSETTAYTSGSRLIRNVAIRARIAKHMNARSERTLVHADYVINGLVDNVQRCQEAVPVMVFDPIEKCMVQKRDGEGNCIYEFDSQGANKALELLGKHLGVFEKDNSQKKPDAFTTPEQFNELLKAAREGAKTDPS